MPANNTVDVVRANSDAQDRDGAETSPVRIWSMTTTGVNALGWLAVVLAVATRGLVTMLGGFYWDDFTLQGRAARLPLDMSFLIYSHDGHVMPLGALVSWITERIAPLEFWLPALTMLGGQAAVAVCAWLLFRRIFGKRPLALLPTLAFLFSAMTLPGAVWWAAALNAIPMQLGILGVTWGAWLIQREGRERAGQIWIVASILFALGFFEKALLIGVWLVLAMWLFSSRPSVLLFIREQWQRRRWLWIGLAALAGAYAMFYASVSDRGSSLPSDLGSFVAAIATAVFVATLPSLIGGPLGWEPVGFGSALARPSGFLALVAFVAVTALIVFAWKFVRRGAYAWIAAGLYLLFITVLMSSTRLAATDPSIGMSGMRYTADAVLPLTLAIGMSVMPIVGDKESGRLARLRRGFASRSRRTTTVALLVLVLVVFISSQTTAGFTSIWSRIESKTWLSNARTTMAQGADEGPILEQQVPSFVIWGLAYPYSNITWLLAPLPQRPEFGEFTNNPRFLMNDGKLVEGRVEGIASVPGPVPQCGWSNDNGDIAITLSGSVFEWEHRAQFDYLASAPSDAVVQLGNGRSVPVRFEGGPHRMVAVVEGGGTELKVSGTQPGSRICIGSATVGRWAEADPFRR